MTNAVDDLETLELLGSTQWGLLTAAQAQEGGVSRMRLSRLVERGTLQRVRHGVYALPSASGGPLQGLRAAWLSTDSRPVGVKETAFVSGKSAAGVHGLGDLVPAVYEFATSVRRQSTQRDVRYRFRTLGERDVTWVDGLPVTTVARTVTDLAASETDQDHLASVVRDALALGASAGALADVLEPRAATFGHTDGRAYLVALLDAAGYEPDPAMEATVRKFSDAVATSLTPQMQQSMANMVEQFARQAGLITPTFDPEVTARILGTLSSQTGAMRAALPDSWSPDAIRRLAENATDTLGSTIAKREALPMPGEDVDEQDAHGSRTGPPKDVAEREARHGSETSGRRG